jgi:hypothetical protein
MGAGMIQVGIGSNWFLDHARTSSVFFDGDVDLSIFGNDGGYSVLNLSFGFQQNF